jgi:predicted DNA-binding transcriptional regulator AlpA
MTAPATLKLAPLDVPASAPFHESLADSGGANDHGGAKRTAAPASDDPDDSLLLNVRQLSRLVSMSVTSTWRAVSAGRLPRPVYISPKAPRWRRSEVEKVVADLKPGQRPRVVCKGA